MTRLQQIKERGRNTELVRQKDNRPWGYSPTQMSMFAGCPRKWFFQYVLGFKPDQSSSQELGSLIHDELEEWIKTGKEPEHPRAIAGLKHLNRGEHVFAEGKALLPLDLPSRAYFTGKIDVFDASDLGHPIVIDHKTTSDLKWAKTEYELPGDIQMMSYAKFALEKFPDADRCTVQHNVIPTKGAPKAVLVSATVDRKTVDTAWNRHLKIIDEIETTRTRELAEVPARGRDNGDCQRFGGCPHLARCQAAAFRRPSKVISPPDAPAPGQPQEEQTKMNANLKERLAQLKAKKEKSAAAPEPAPEKPASANKAKERAKAMAAKRKAAPEPEPINQKLGPKLRAEKAKAEKKLPDPPPTTALAVPVTEEPKKTSKPRKKLTLYLNCAPLTGSGTETLDAWIAPTLAKVQTETGLHWSLHDYGKGKGHVISALNKLEDKDLPSALVVDLNAPIAEVALESLSSRAKAIVRGF